MANNLEEWKKEKQLWEEQRWEKEKQQLQAQMKKEKQQLQAQMEKEYQAYVEKEKQQQARIEKEKQQHEKDRSQLAREKAGVPKNLAVTDILPCVLGNCLVPTFQQVANRVKQDNSVQAENARAFIRRLIEHQGHHKAQEIAPSLSIVNSSGTGKSQLAQSCQAVVQASDEVSVLYLLANELNIETAQQFYQQHIGLGNLLCDTFAASSFGTSKFVSATKLKTGNKKTVAFGLLAILLKYSETKQLPPTVHDGEIPLPKLSFRDLEAYVADARERGHKFLVFVDEIPPLGTEDNENFYSAINLRNVLCAVGISPIMMSTYSDFINTMHDSGAGNADDPKVGTVVIPNLPPFVPSWTGVDKAIGQKNEFLAMLQTCTALDRPLVAQILQDYIEKQLTTTNLAPTQIGGEEELDKFYQGELQMLIDQVAAALFARKSTWDLYAQFLLTFSAGDKFSAKCSAHALVGKHFGHLDLKTEEEVTHPKNWLEQARCVFPSCMQEPFLVFALLSWVVQGTKTVADFPLLDFDYMSPITVLQAYMDNEAKFEKHAILSNKAAPHRSVAPLEALIHGALTLASFVGGVRGGGPLSVFLSNVARLVCHDGVVDLTSRNTPLPELADAIPGSLGAVLVPALPPGGDLPPFSQRYGYCASCIRPDKERVDGTLQFTPLRAPPGASSESPPPTMFFLTVVSENQGTGFDTTFFKCVMQRVAEDVNMLIVVVPSIPKNGVICQQKRCKENSEAKKGVEEAKNAKKEFAELCGACSHSAFKDPKNRLRIVAVRGEEDGGFTTTYVKVAGKAQKGDPSQITLMVVIFVVPVRIKKAKKKTKTPPSKRRKIDNQGKEDDERR